MKMTQRYIALLFVVLLCSIRPLVAASGIAVGLRGGGQMWLPSSNEGTTLHPSFGGAGGLDIRYLYYHPLTPSFELGLTAGVGFGYGIAGIQGTTERAFSNTDYLGNTLAYSTSTAFRQQETFAALDASLMLAIRAGGFVANVGPRFMMPLAVAPSLTVTESTIAATYPDYNVTVTNELITGRLSTPFTQQVAPQLPSYNLLLGLEAGWEWSLQEQHALGVMAYADIAVWSTPNTVLPTPLVEVAPITDAANPAAQVTVNSADGLISGRRFIDFGVKVYYAFSFLSSQPARTKKTTSRDSRDHRNRYLGL